MKAFVEKLKTIIKTIWRAFTKILGFLDNLHYLIYIVIIIIGFIFGGDVLNIFHHKLKPVVVTITNQGNTVYIQSLKYYTNNITNIVYIDRIKTLYTDDSNYNYMPFVFSQSNDLVKADLYKRYASYKVTQWESEKRYFIGPQVGVNTSGAFLGAVGGIQWQYFGIDANVYFGSISNAGVSVGAFLRY